MKFLQHNDPLVRIPQHISRNAFYTSPLFLMSSYCVYFKMGHILLALLLLSLFFTTVGHWNKVYYSSMIKIADMFFALSVIIVATFHDSYYLDSYYRNTWIYSITTSICAFTINEYVLYIRITPNLKSKITIGNKCWAVEYIESHTMERERAYYDSTFIHIFFLHILPNITCIYCVNSFVKC
jgi:hypothetical protein